MSRWTGGPTGNAAYLQDVLSALWPGETVEVGSAASANSSASEWAAVPSRRRPVMLVPTGSASVTSTAFREASIGTGSGRRRLMAGMAMAANLGGGALLRGRVSVRGGTDGRSLASYLDAALGISVHMAVRASPVRPNRKPVLHLIGDDGRSIGFAKVGWNDLTGPLVQHEHDALRRLSEVALPGVVVPPVIHYGRWLNSEVLVLGPLRPHGRQSWTREELRHRMITLARGTQPESSTVSAAEYAQRLDATLAGVQDEQIRTGLMRGLTRVGATGAGVWLELGAWHGDWAPWNMARAGEAMLVWDWERFAVDVPIGYDLVHHELQANVVRGGQPVDDAAARLVESAPALLAGVVEDSRAARLTVLFYLIELGARFAQGSEHQSGTTMAASVGTWLLPIVCGDSVAAR